MRIEAFPDLILAYIEEQLRGRPSFEKMMFVASQWAGTLTATPTRAEILARQQAVCAGHCQPGATKSNTELALVRAACRWGLYQERWTGGDPTLGIRKWRTPKRRRVGKREEMKKLIAYFAATDTYSETPEQAIRDRALFGLMLFTVCRPGEARTARLDAITPYGEMGAWIKGRTKTGENQEIPLPTQLMPWMADWKAIRPNNVSPFLFPGQWMGEPMTHDAVKKRWYELRLILGIHGLWNYDLRRSLATHMSNELNYSDAKIDAILGHEKTSSLGHYLHVSFDAMTEPIQRYADWLWALHDPAAISRKPVVPLPTAPRAVQQAQPHAPVISAPAYTPPPVRLPVRQSGVRPLSARERQILALIAEGRSYQEMGEALGLSIHTVCCYRGRLLDRLQLTTTGELIQYAQDHALTKVPMVVIKRGRIGFDRTRGRDEREEWAG